jgi:RND family efflux transporter MFP subunit
MHDQDSTPLVLMGDASQTAVPAHGHDAHSHVPVHYSKSTRIGVIIFAIVVGVGLCILFVVGQRSRKIASNELGGEATTAADQPATVDTVRVLAAPADTMLSLPGEARSFYETTIFARTSGYVSKWLVDIGDPVKEGQTLALIETPELDDQMAAAKAKLEALKAEVHVAETTSTFAKVSFDRWEAAAPEGAVSHQERDQKKSELDSSLAKLEAAKAQVALGQADVQRLTTLIGFKKVTAPFEGTITQRHVDVGALVTAGSTTNTSPLFSISQSKQIRVFVDVPQSVVPFVKVGMEVVATAREYPGRKFIGKVDRTAESMDAMSKSLRVQVLVPNEDHTLLPGMYVQVAFQKTRKLPPLRVPAGALCFRTRGPQVAVVTADHHVSFHDVTITRDMGDFIEVDSGLQPNDTVALNVGNDINDGERVDPHAIDQPAEAGDAHIQPMAASVTGTKPQ